MKQQLTLTAVYQEVPEGYIGFALEIPGAQSQGGTLEECRSMLQEAAELVIECRRETIEKEFAGQTLIREDLKVSS